MDWSLTTVQFTAWPYKYTLKRQEDLLLLSPPFKQIEATSCHPVGSWFSTKSCTKSACETILLHNWDRTVLLSETNSENDVKRLKGCSRQEVLTNGGGDLGLRHSWQVLRGTWREQLWSETLNCLGVNPVTVISEMLPCLKWWEFCYPCEQEQPGAVLSCAA